MKFEFSILIHAPRELVWRVAQDTAVRASWDVRVKNYQVHGIAAAGTPLTITFRVPFVSSIGNGYFTLFDPPHQSAIRIDAMSSALLPTGGGSWIFDDVNGATRLTTKFFLKDRSIGAFPNWVLNIGATIDTFRSLHKLRRLAEKQFAAAELQPGELRSPHVNKEADVTR